MLCFRKLPVAKKVMEKRWVSRFFVGFISLTVAKKFVGEHFCAVFEKNSDREKIYGQEGGYQGFPSENFCLTMPKSFIGELFVLCCRKIPVAKKNMDEGGGRRVSRFSVERFFCLRVPKIFVGENFCAVIQKVSVSEKIYGKQRGYQDFPSKDFCLNMPKNFAREPVCVVFQKTFGSGKSYR